jgi:hypothetical protein
MQVSARTQTHASTCLAAHAFTSWHQIILCVQAVCAYLQQSPRMCRYESGNTLAAMIFACTCEATADNAWLLALSFQLAKAGAVSVCVSVYASVSLRYLTRTKYHTHYMHSG